jgi:hypothetical protein
MKTKHLLNGVAVLAALAITAPVWAQTAGGNSYGGNSMGVPGPNPGGPNTPGTINSGSFGDAPSPQPASTATMPPASTSVVPPAHHAVRHAKAMHAFHKGMAHKAALTGDTTAQLNREELARIQSGGLSTPALAPMSPPMSEPMRPPTPMANPSGGNSMGMPGPNTGGPGLTPYTR